MCVFFHTTIITYPKGALGWFSKWAVLLLVKEFKFPCFLVVLSHVVTSSWRFRFINNLALPGFLVVLVLTFICLFSSRHLLLRTGLITFLLAIRSLDSLVTTRAVCFCYVQDVLLQLCCVVKLSHSSLISDDSSSSARSWNLTPTVALNLASMSLFNRFAVLYFSCFFCFLRTVRERQIVVTA